MNKLQHHVEQMIALTLIAFAFGLWFGEAPRDVTYGKLKPTLHLVTLQGTTAIDTN